MGFNQWLHRVRGNRRPELSYIDELAISTRKDWVKFFKENRENICAETIGSEIRFRIELAGSSFIHVLYGIFPTVTYGFFVDWEEYPHGSEMRDASMKYLQYLLYVLDGYSTGVWNGVCDCKTLPDLNEASQLAIEGFWRYSCDEDMAEAEAFKKEVTCTRSNYRTLFSQIAANPSSTSPIEYTASEIADTAIHTRHKLDTDDALHLLSSGFAYLNMPALLDLLYNRQ